MNNTPNIRNLHHRPPAKHQRIETLRPLVQKYQYTQLPLPEPHPPDEKAAPRETPQLPRGEESCENSYPSCS
ncbi:MAG: hypothetical protein N2117_13835 [Anaerolineales bacterium]|nr:hypothetical protein [Anaerolineales bacterium]MCX7756306.1 hypothetical protein [Anaerolineales bacterium]MDW8276612.1 hypothetical protein [Anaerolineales bacterium]